MINSRAVKLLLSSVVAALMLAIVPGGAESTHTPSPTLTGRWQVEFTLNSPHRLQFDAQASGEGTFLTLDPVSAIGTLPAATKAAWELRGQSSAIYYFVIAGDLELPTRAGGIQKGRLELSASSDLALPINSLHGWGQFRPSDRPNDGRGSEDPFFDFTAVRADKLSVQVTAPDPGQKLRRGKEVRIEWSVETFRPLDSQEVLLSLDGGASFVAIASDLGGDVRDFTWALPEGIPRTKKGLIKIVVTDKTGASAEGVTAGTLRIK